MTLRYKCKTLTLTISHSCPPLSHTPHKKNAPTLPGKAKPPKPAARITTAAAPAGQGSEAGELSQVVNTDGTTIPSSSPPPTAAAAAATVTTSSSSGSVNIVVAKYGARALENGGPLQDLRAILYQYMRPWRPAQTLHIGLVDPLVHTSLDASAGSSAAGASSSGGDAEGTKFIDHRQLYFQWCALPKE